MCPDLKMMFNHNICLPLTQLKLPFTITAFLLQFYNCFINAKAILLEMNGVIVLEVRSSSLPFWPLFLRDEQWTNSVLQSKTVQVIDLHSVQMRYKTQGDGDELIARRRHSQEWGENGACCPFNQSAFLHGLFFSASSSLGLSLLFIRQWGNPGWEECSDKVQRTRVSKVYLKTNVSHKNERLVLLEGYMYVGQKET